MSAPAPAMPAGRNPLQGVTTALTRSMIGSSFPELNQPVNHKKKQYMAHNPGGTLMVAAPKTRKSELNHAQLKRINEHKIAAFKPEWKSLDRKTLRFYGFFREPVVESPTENARLRKVIVLFYLEDDTIQVSEPRQVNSGLTQGALIKRHRVVKQHHENGAEDYFGPDDLEIGGTISLYGKTIVLLDCDAFTRDFFASAGIELPEAIPYPDDVYEKWRLRHLSRGTKDTELKRVMELDASQRTGGTVLKMSQETRDLAKSFFANDRKVLRFNCVWKDPTIHGTSHLFTLLYYLADGSCCVSEPRISNSGTDPFPTFLKKQRLPKPGSPSQPTDIETLCKKKAHRQEYYTDVDLFIGKTVNVFGRVLTICDMDEATRNYYKAQFGMEDFTPLPMPEQRELVEKVRPQRRVFDETQAPPHTGFGSDIDSLGSWKNLILKAPKRDCAKELRDRDKVMRFGARIVSDHPTDEGRKFIISYYLADNTLQVFEQPEQNSGQIGGKFLVRQRVKTSPPGARVPVYLMPEGLYVGAKVKILSTVFDLVETDERTVALMEGRPKQFTMSDVNAVLKKVREFVLMRHTQVTDAFRSFDRDHSGSISLDEFRQALVDQQIDVSDHELVTLMRYFDVNSDGVVSYKEFVDRMMPRDYAGDLDEEKGADEATAVEMDASKYHSAQSLVDKQRFSDRVFKMFFEKVSSRRAQLQDGFRAIADASMDGAIGEREFRNCLHRHYELYLTAAEEDALVWKFFYNPTNGRVATRLSLKDFNRVFESASTFMNKYL
ncbi:putative calcium-binding protein CML16 [Diplonema papillatum]|nr:putative calcium-binding protein CML16 [Diplonema papillatum]|eukprot:gene21147-32576_t